MSSVFQSFEQMLRSRLPYFARARQKQFSRRYERHECVVIGAMGLLKVGADYPGLIVELSLGGCSFRPASLFMLDRASESVTIRCEYFEIDGIIKATRPDGYGVQFLGELAPEVLLRVTREHGGPLAGSFLAAETRAA